MNLDALFDQVPPMKPSDFIIEQQIGEGAFGRVVRAFHIPTKQLVAIKQISIPRMQQLNEEQAVLREVLFLTAVRQNQRSDFTPRFYGYYQTQLELCLVSELCECNLVSLKKQKKLSLQAVKVLSALLIIALTAMHKFGFGHRDVKPDNVLVCLRGLVLTDFNTAKQLSDSDTQTLNGQRASFVNERLTIVGTEKYAAPEQLNGEAHSQIAIDTYSVGLIIQELLEGQRATNEITELMNKLCSSDPMTRIEGGIASVKRLQFFKGIDFENLPRMNIGAISTQEELFGTSKRELKLAQHAFTCIAYLEPNEKAIAFVDGVAIDKKKAIAVATTAKRCIFVDEKSHELLADFDLVATDQRTLEHNGYYRLTSNGVTVSVEAPPLKCDELSEVFSKSLSDESPQPTKCRYCGEQFFQNGFCNACGSTYLQLQRLLVGNLVLLDPALLPTTLRQRALQSMIEVQESDVKVKRKGKRFADVFQVADDDAWVVEVME